MCLIALLLLGGAFAHMAGQGGAAQSPQAPVFHAGVDLVQVHAVVTDEHGDAVHDLRQSDFQVFDRGRPQIIATFAEVRQAPLGPPVFPPLLARDVSDNQLADQSSRLVVLLFDDLHVRDRRDLAVNLLRRLIHDIAPPVSFALVSTSGLLGVEPTEDPAQIERAIARYTVPSGGVRGGGPVATPIPTWAKLWSTANSLTRDEHRRKVCIVISSYTGGSDDLDALGPDLATSSDAMRSTLQLLLRSNMTVYVLDPSFETGAYPPFEYITAATGGFAVGADVLAAGLTRLADDLDHYYLLGFSPADAADGKMHQLEVRVTRPGVNVRARTSYVQGGKATLSKGETPLMDLAWYPEPVTDLPLRLFAAPFFVAGAEPNVAVGLEVTAGAHRNDNSPPATEHLGFGLMAIRAGDAKARLKVERHADFPLPPAPEGQPSRYLVLTTLALVPGRYQLRASGMSSVAGKGGSVYLQIEVPDPKAGDIVLGGVVVGREGAPTTPVADNATLTGVTLPFAPTVDRQFVAGDLLRVFFQVTRRDIATAATGTISLVNSNERQVVSEPWSVNPHDGGLVDARVTTAGLPSGAYRLFVSVADRMPSALTQRQIGLLLR